MFCFEKIFVLFICDLGENILKEIIDENVFGISQKCSNKKVDENIQNMPECQ